MQEVDPGHEYLLDSYDGGEPIRVRVIRELKAAIRMAEIA